VTDLDLLVEAGGAAWTEGDGFQAHEWWEAAWLRQADGPLKEGLRGLTQWAAAAHLEILGRYAAAQTIRDRARARLCRTANRLALAPFALDVPSDKNETLLLRDRDAPFAVTTVLLAAGHGRRAGGPKALLQVAGQPLWLRQVERLRSVGLHDVVAVLHPDAQPIAGSEARIVIGDPDGTPLHSLQAALAQTHGAVLLLPVDCPVPARGVVARLLATGLRDRQALAARPVVQTPEGPRGGHPVWLAAATCQRLAVANAQTERLDAFLHSLGRAYVDVPVTDAGVLGNFNLNGVSR
jgi:CTP:molybdopterin cytidylyltransferase MocA